MWVATTRRPWRGQRLLQPLVQQHAVGQAGERVVQRHVARPVGQLQDMADVLAEGVPVERLEQERGGARRQRALERAAALVAGQDDDGDVLERGVPAHAPDEVEAVEVRHLEIDDGQIEDHRFAGATAPRGRPPPRPRRRAWQPFSRRRRAKRRRRPQPGPMAFALLPRAPNPVQTAAQARCGPRAQLWPRGVNEPVRNRPSPAKVARHQLKRLP